jgi:aminoglycoside phosphotransferase (APT) family kinase protein
MTHEEACERLRALGVSVDSSDVTLEEREGRWLVRLPGGRVAWFAATDSARSAMALERRVLRLVASRCGFAVPRVLAETDDGAVDVRSMVPGLADPLGLYTRVLADAGVAERVGAALGGILAELHSAIRAADVADLALPLRPGWPESRDWIRERLPAVVADRELHARADEIMVRHDELQSSLAGRDRVLVHSDLGFHNLSFDAASGDVKGVFDWESACWSDRHFDFRYLALDAERPGLLDAEIAAYQPHGGFSSREGASHPSPAISRSRVFLYNAASAICYLAFRAGVPPEQRWAGRTLAEDLRWTHTAIARVFG